MAVSYRVETDGTFVITDYNNAKLFCSFFPGIAGEHGIPGWAFYLNRGQGMAGFGFGNKDGALQEFVPADKAPWYTAWRGFRTLIKVGIYGQTIFYEPFRSGNELEWDVQTKMLVRPAEIEFEEINQQLGLQVKVTYFTLPQEPVGGLYRKTELVNLRQTEMRLELVDGLAVILPAGFSNYHAKHMGATVRAWMQTELIAGAPYYKLKYLPDDVPELLPVHSGHFCYGYRVVDHQVRPLQPIYDPALVFGSGLDYQPVAFRDSSFRYRAEQIKENQLPAALHYWQLSLAPGEQTEVYQLYGAVPGGVTQLTELLAKINPDYYAEHRELNRKLIGTICDHALTFSGEPRFDSYIRQCFLDNALRGGLPVTLSGGNSAGAKVFWLYSRKHGDLERDYNDFYLSPTYFSQGNGNFRDICQNRRNDLWFNPDLRDAALRYFWNLIQLDGYNPLVVQGINYCREDAAGLTSLLPQDLPEDACRKIEALVTGPFTPGELWQLLADGLKLTPAAAWLIFETVISGAAQLENAVPGDGYWIDHWVYLLDLLEAFVNIYPDEIVNACILRHDYTFYDNWNRLSPLGERYSLIDGEVRRRDSVRLDPEKQRLIKARTRQHHTVRINNGQADTVYRTNLLVKMLTLALNKLCSFDPLVTGLEMDAGRPGWCDAVNGLPGILGASVAEVFALKRLLEQIGLLSLRLASGAPVVVPVELGRFFEAWVGCWENPPGSPAECLVFWEQTHQIRAAFLEEVRLGLDGRELELGQAQLHKFLEKAGALAEQAVAKAYQFQTGLYHTYFYYQVGRWQPVAEVSADSGSGSPVFVRPLEFSQRTLPLFLEAQVNAMRDTARKSQAGNLYQAVRASSLFDSKLGMYKVCADLSGAPDELGRIRVFPRGWLEHESIFLHMEYKYLLELLRAGLVQEFYAELPRVAVCFLEPEQYGRNPVENVSFIVSGAYPRAELHGNGFVARLSGSTAEMLQIWLWLSFGSRPFRLNPQNQLELVFEPLLTGDMFSNDARGVEVCWANDITRCYCLPAHSYCAKFLNRTLVVYCNPNRKATFGSDPAQVRQIELTFWDGRRLTVTQPVLTGEIATAVRLGRVERIDLRLE